VVVDIKMPPTHTDEGLSAAQQIGQRRPAVGVLVLSHYLEPRYAMRLLQQLPNAPATCSRTASPTSLSSPTRCTGSAKANASSTPLSVSRLVAPRSEGPLAQLTEREREALALMAEGHCNEGIGERLFVSPRTVKTHVRQIFLKLDLHETPSYHCRVVAVLTLLRSN
jgi:DNA-binding NarL/FixJ family response regulator